MTLLKDKVGLVTGAGGGIGEAITDAVVFLASDRSSFITGHSLIIDGGVTVKTDMG